MNVNFEIPKIQRMVDTIGSEFTLIKYKQGKFHEVSSEVDLQINFKGVLHISTEFITIGASIGSKVQKKNKYMILCLKDVNTDQVLQGDTISHNGITYIVSGKTNYMEQNYAYDISLEVVV